MQYSEFSIVHESNLAGWWKDANARPFRLFDHECLLTHALAALQCFASLDHHPSSAQGEVLCTMCTICTITISPAPHPHSGIGRPLQVPQVVGSRLWVQPTVGAAQVDSFVSQPVRPPVILPCKHICTHTRLVSRPHIVLVRTLYYTHTIVTRTINSYIRRVYIYLPYMTI